MGKKDFEVANCVRVMLGETKDLANTEASAKKSSDEKVYELSCNVDDMTAEAISFAIERLFEAGANEVYTVPVGMKKSRPGTLIRVLCKPEEKEKMVQVFFAHTSTIGIRETLFSRYVLERKIVTVETPYGPVRCKISEGYGVTRKKFEYEDLARIAREQNISLAEAEARVKESAEKAE